MTIQGTSCPRFSLEKIAMVIRSAEKRQEMSSVLKHHFPPPGRLGHCLTQLSIFVHP